MNSSESYYIRALLINHGIRERVTLVFNGQSFVTEDNRPKFYKSIEEAKQDFDRCATQDEADTNIYSRAIIFSLIKLYNNLSLDEVTSRMYAVDKHRMRG